MFRDARASASMKEAFEVRFEPVSSTTSNVKVFPTELYIGKRSIDYLARGNLYNISGFPEKLSSSARLLSFLRPLSLSISDSSALIFPKFRQVLGSVLSYGLSLLIADFLDYYGGP